MVDISGSSFILYNWLGNFKRGFFFMSIFPLFPLPINFARKKKKRFDCGEHQEWIASHVLRVRTMKMKTKTIMRRCQLLRSKRNLQFLLLRSPLVSPPSSLAFKLPTEFFASFTVTKIAIKHLNQFSVLSFCIECILPCNMWSTLEREQVFKICHTFACSCYGFHYNSFFFFVGFLCLFFFGVDRVGLEASPSVFDPLSSSWLLTATQIN